jgi:hypothetical protein
MWLFGQQRSLLWYLDLYRITTEQDEREEGVKVEYLSTLFRRSPNDPSSKTRPIDIVDIISFR